MSDARAVGPEDMGGGRKRLDEIIPLEYLERFFEVVKNDVFTTEFQGKAVALLGPCRVVIESASGVSLEEFVRGAQGSFLRLIQEAEANKATPENPVRVDVWSGDRSESWGRGSYVGDVRVFAVFDQTREGMVLRSLAEAEGVPSLEEFPPGTAVQTLDDNPKIILDTPRPDGRKVVYGCQVWWAEVPPGAESGEAVSQEEFELLLTE